MNPAAAPGGVQLTKVEYDDSLIRRMSSAMNSANAFEVESVMRNYLGVFPRKRLDNEAIIVTSVYTAARWRTTSDVATAPPV